jgi:hypothetical protein
MEISYMSVASGAEQFVPPELYSHFCHMHVWNFETVPQRRLE